MLALILCLIAACAAPPCDPTGDSAQALTRANEDYRQADIAMNKAYAARLQAQPTPAARAAFMDAQADWLARRDAACAGAPPADDSNSTGWSIARADCLTRQTGQRTADLQPPPASANELPQQPQRCGW